MPSDAPAAFATSGPLYDEAWECLRQDMVFRLKLIPASAWDHRMESKRLVGEVWMLDGTFYTERTCDLTGIKTVGWFHNFRHRGVDQNGGQRMVRYYLSRLDPRKLIQTIDGQVQIELMEHRDPAQTPQVLPIRTVKHVDDGNPF